MGRRAIAVFVVLGVTAGGSGHAAAGASRPAVTAVAARTQLRFGRSTQITGRLSGLPGGSGGVALQLEADPYPFRSLREMASTTTQADGSYAYTVAPRRNTRYRVVAAGPPAVQSAVLRLTVNPAFRIRLRDRRLGRVRIAIVALHPAGMRWGDRRTLWYLGQPGRSRLRRA